MPLSRVLRSIAPRRRGRRAHRNRVEPATIVEPAPIVENIFEPRPPLADYEQNRPNWFRRVGSAYRLGRREGDTLNYVFSAMMPSGNRLLNTQILRNTQRRNNRMRDMMSSDVDADADVDVDANLPAPIHPYGYAPEKPPSYKSVKSSSDKKTRKHKKNSPKPPKYVDVKYSPPPIKPPSYTRRRRSHSRGGNKRKTCKKY